MGKTSGPVLHHCYIGSQQNNVKLVGMNGWIQVSKKQNGAVKKMKNFYI